MDVSNAGDIASRSPETRHEPTFNAVIAHDHNNRNSRRRRLDDWGLLAAKREDHIRIQAYQFICHRRELFVLRLRVSIVDGDGLSVDVAKRLQSLQERPDGSPIVFRKDQYAHPALACGLLRTYRERVNSRYASE